MLAHAALDLFMTPPVLDLLHSLFFVGASGYAVCLLALPNHLGDAKPAQPEAALDEKLKLAGKGLLAATLLLCGSSLLIGLALDGGMAGAYLALGASFVIGSVLAAIYAGLYSNPQKAGASKLVYGILLALALPLIWASHGSFAVMAHRLLGALVIAGVWMLTIDPRPAPRAQQNSSGDDADAGLPATPAEPGLAKLGATFILAGGLLQFGAGLYLLGTYGNAVNGFLSEVTHASAAFIASLVAAFLMLLLAFVVMALRGRRGGKASLAALWVMTLLVLTGMYAAKRGLHEAQQTSAYLVNYF